jgi:hypothetical protein
MFHCVVWYTFTNISVELPASIIAPIKEAVPSYDMSVNIYQITWCNIPEDRHLCDSIWVQDENESYRQPTNSIAKNPSKPYRQLANKVPTSHQSEKVIIILYCSILLGMCCNFFHSVTFIHSLLYIMLFHYP